ncbi:hypothetical protein JCM17844_09830 [Iodidimonas gelatinilytica]|uniref:Uncharacterized protein n=1 Tax=Iodidimonas gelatinilytica TaxID=1236966 RepID=A0A5A7MNC0_9PROT|nr:YeeE/YedE thiosulfate transporter family protein [Iodidimonas gelatinilytica]GEQ97346.1 hypothetical protein JCM17844_09830 [Iodidimonas gelatinilytica]
MARRVFAGLDCCAVDLLGDDGGKARNHHPVPLLLVVLGGFLVGVGTILGGGCTSGHGVCGVARLSHRSVIATISFMATGIATVFVMRHLLGMW